MNFRSIFHTAPTAAAIPTTKRATRSCPARVSFYTTGKPQRDDLRQLRPGVAGFTPQVKAMWFRGGWFDSLSFLWKEISTGTFSVNDGSGAAESTGRNGGSILVQHALGAGETVTIPVILTWYFPNVDYSYGEYRGEGEADAWSFAEQGTADCGDDCDCHKIAPPRWHPYYATQWKDAKDVLIYVRDQYQNLRQRTQAFHDALFNHPSRIMSSMPFPATWGSSNLQQFCARPMGMCGPGKGVFAPAAAATGPARTYGTTPNPYPICSPSSSVLCASRS